jgi:hypothetical protein
MPELRPSDSSSCGVWAWLVLAGAVLCAGSHSDERSAGPEPQRLRARALELAERGDIGEALELADRAADLTPAEPEPWSLLGGLHAAAGHPREARRIYLWCVVRTAGSGVERCRPSPLAR